MIYLQKYSDIYGRNQFFVRLRIDPLKKGQDERNLSVRYLGVEAIFLIL